MLKVGGLLPPGCKLLDTPGVPHDYQLASLLTPEEMRMVLPRRQLRARTFRMGVGQVGDWAGGRASGWVGRQVGGWVLCLNLNLEAPVNLGGGKEMDRPAPRSAPPMSSDPFTPARPPVLLLLPQSVQVGGVARVDVLASPGATLYLSVFASDAIGCHFGRTEGVEER